MSEFHFCVAALGIQISIVIRRRISCSNKVCLKKIMDDKMNILKAWAHFLQFKANKIIDFTSSRVPALSLWKNRPEQSVCELSCSVMSGSLQPHGLQPAGLPCPWCFPGKDTEWVAISCSRGSSWLKDQACLRESLPLDEGEPRPGSDLRCSEWRTSLGSVELLGQCTDTTAAPSPLE